MTTAISRLAQDTIKACEGFKNSEEDSFYYDYPNAAHLLAKIVLEMEKALEWVIHPKHDEPDDYTRLACAQHRAFEAIEKSKQIAEGK